MWTVGVTLVIQFEENKIRKQEVEVKALAAIANCEDRILANKAIRSLCHICWPDDERFHKEIEAKDSVIEKWL